MHNHEAQPELDLLNQAFSRFSEAADTLSGYYDRLVRETAEVKADLERKNRALTAGLAEQNRNSRFLTHILDNLNTGVMVLDPQGRTSLVNRAAASLLGLPENGRETPDLRGFLGHVDPQTWDPAAGNPKLIVRPGPGGRLLSGSLSRFPWPSPEEGPFGLMVLVEDVTDPVNLGAQRERTQALAAMGEMAAEVAHQIRNPLGGIELIASILGREVAGEENLEGLVDNILIGVKRIDNLIANYLTLSRPPQADRRPAELGGLVEEALAGARESLDRQGVTVNVRVPEKGAWVDGDRELLQQVFLNLILNSVEAMDRGGSIDVEIKTGRRRVEAVFKDDGRGIRTQDVGRIFNPFFTTKEKNLGLGLAVSHRIIDAHGGMIQVRSRPGKGAVFTVTLPALPQRPKSNQH